MKVTVAICTWNRVSLLRQTLDRLRQCVVPNGVTWEVLVVDNGSMDGTRDFVASVTDFPCTFRWVIETEAGVSHARNRALSESHAALVLFIDDDVLVDPSLVAAFIDAADRHPKAGALGGVVEPWFPTEPDPVLLAAFPALQRGFCGTDLGASEEVLTTGRHLTGANLGYRVSSLKGLRFRADLGPNGSGTVGGEESDLQDRIRETGAHVVWIPAMRVQHYVDPRRMTLSYLLKFAEDHGRKQIRMDGIPPGPRVAGVPRWLLGQVVREQLRATADMVAGKRVEQLDHQRKRAEFMGMVKECLAARRVEHSQETISRASATTQ